jgi:hypothetical protein
MCSSPTPPRKPLRPLSLPQIVIHTQPGLLLTNWFTDCLNRKQGIQGLETERDYRKLDWILTFEVMDHTERGCLGQRNKVAMVCWRTRLWDWIAGIGHTDLGGYTLGQCKHENLKIAEELRSNFRIVPNYHLIIVSSTENSSKILQTLTKG